MKSGAPGIQMNGFPGFCFFSLIGLSWTELSRFSHSTIFPLKNVWAVWFVFALTDFYTKEISGMSDE